jgi:hypothetical protein
MEQSRAMHYWTLRTSHSRRARQRMSRLHDETVNSHQAANMRLVALHRSDY